MQAWKACRRCTESPAAAPSRLAPFIGGNGLHRSEYALAPLNFSLSPSGSPVQQTLIPHVLFLSLPPSLWHLFSAGVNSAPISRVPTPGLWTYSCAEWSGGERNSFFLRVPSWRRFVVTLEYRASRAALGTLPCAVFRRRECRRVLVVCARCSTRSGKENGCLSRRIFPRMPCGPCASAHCWNSASPSIPPCYPLPPPPTDTQRPAA